MTLSYITSEEISCEHDFIKVHINFVLEDPETYNEFYVTFQEYFLRAVLSGSAYESIQLVLQGIEIEQKKLQYLINNLRRIFNNEQHFKGLVGEHLFSFYYHNMIEDVLWAHGPKGRSSAEPGIDFITFNGNKYDKEQIKITVWETKTTENTVSSRASEIYDFFSEDGSFEENIDSEIKIIQEHFKYKEDNSLKEVVGDLYNIVLNRDKRFCIGAAGVSPLNETTNNTFKKFADCFSGDLSKEQRVVKFLFIKLLNNILTDLRDKVWKKL